MVKDIELLRRVFVSDFGQFMDRGTVWRSLNEHPAFRNSISIARAESWKPIRRCISPAFTANKLRALTRPDLLQCMLEMEFDSTHTYVSGFQWTEEERELQNGKEKVVLPIKDVAANAANMLQAGFETVGVTLSHCLFCIAKFQAVQDKIRAETEAALAKHGEFSYDAISDLQYTAQTILETLRIYTPVISFTTRRASSDYRYENVLLREGVSVMACSHQVHRDPNLWERPGEFDPDRFSPEQRASRDPLAFQAFGVGPRNCVGMKLAQLEMALVVAKLVHRFRLHLGSKHVNGELKRHTYSIIACPADGVWIRLEKLMRG
ncbi:cytochrome P450 6a8-like isoform X3 [Dermacentor variabilis]|uniref:cytochrome P450 6a8-like isoform X3 n=1 Tax=Dermacentor variabilis TaxID=34621 RepID=UPI003F5BD14D